MTLKVWNLRSEKVGVMAPTCMTGKGLLCDSNHLIHSRPERCTGIPKNTCKLVREGSSVLTVKADIWPGSQVSIAQGLISFPNILFNPGKSRSVRVLFSDNYHHLKYKMNEGLIPGFTEFTSRLLPARQSLRRVVPLRAELGSQLLGVNDRRRRPCHWRATSSGHERYVAVSHGHSAEAVGLDTGR